MGIMAENIGGGRRPAASADRGETRVDYTPDRATRLPLFYFFQVRM
jgi:hypothetical protein